MTAHSEDIIVETREGRFSAYVSIPTQPHDVGVVVLQEIFGVNANIRAICNGLAATGYAAVAPDLYWRNSPGIQLDPSSEADRSRAMELMKTLDRDAAASDSVAALSALLAQVPGLSRTAAVGYCFGGGVAFLMAAQGLVDAGVAYYGTGLHTMLDQLGRGEARLLLHIAGDDYLCPPEAQSSILAAAETLDGVEVVVHPGVSHAFARVGGGAFDEQAADRANRLTMELLASMSSR